MGGRAGDGGTDGGTAGDPGAGADDGVAGSEAGLDLRPIDPEGDAPLLHRWVSEERARFWGMGEHTLAEVREVYAYLDGLDSHHAYLMLLGGRPVGVFQTYEPENDPVGECYPVQPGDLGFHLLLAPSAGPTPRLTTGHALALGGQLFASPAVRRLVAEPDARNHRALRALQRFGFELAAEVDLPTKRARLAFLPRERYEQLAAAAASGGTAGTGRGGP